MLQLGGGKPQWENTEEIFQIYILNSHTNLFLF